MKAIYIITIALTGLFVGACKKDKKNKSGAQSVSIVFTEPSLGDSIPSWNQVHMEGTITGDGEMKGYTVSARNASTNAVLFSSTYDVKASAYNFHEHWINNLYDTTNVTIRVEVIKDGSGNLETKEMNVVCLP